MWMRGLVMVEFDQMRGQRGRPGVGVIRRDRSW